MYKLANFDDKEYKELIDRFHSSRKGKPIDNFYQELKKLKPGGFISDDLKKRLDKWRETPEGPWWAAGSYAGPIQDLILDRTHGGGEYVRNKKALSSRPINVEEIFHMPCEYDYLFICPRQKYESGKKEYSTAIPRIQNPNLRVLREEYEYLSLKEKIDPDPVKKSLFEDFLSAHHEHIHVLFWDQLFDVLEETDPGFLAKYMENLQLKDESMYKIWHSRLKLASIPYKK